MSIKADDTIFPNNIVALLVDRFKTLDDSLVVVPRRLRQTDANESVGVFAGQWTPNEDSYEMSRAQVGGSEPTLQRYHLVVEGFVKDGNEESGLARHTVLAKQLRAMLYRDNTLGLSLRALSVPLFGSTERTQRYGVQTQRYISTEVQGTYLYLSTLDFWLETETV